MKKILSLILALVMGLGLVAPSGATLANSSAYTRYKTQDVYPALITATALDTTTNADSNTITNLDGSITDISLGVKATNQTGTSPTLTISLLGSYDNSVFFQLKSMQASTAGTVAVMATAALDISTASTTAVASGFSVSQYRPIGSLLPPYLRLRVTVGGTGTPGWTGVAYAVVKR